MDVWAGVVAAVQAAAQEAEPWRTAEWHLLDQAFRERLSAAGILPGADAGAVLMIASVFMAEHTAEFGGDTRDALADMAQLGMRLLTDAAEGPTG